MESDNKKYIVIVSERATQMLVSHSRFLAQVNEQAALNLITDFQSQANSLETLPERCPWLEDSYLPSKKYYKLIMGKWYLLIFQIKKDCVYIDYVVDCRQKNQWLL